jgi:CRP-like cAMP-binding protein
MTLEHALKEHHFTANLDHHHLALLAEAAREVRFQSDQPILLAGERSTHFYLLRSGSVCVEIHNPVYSVCVQVLEPGDAFGWSSLLGDHDTLFQVRAREASTAICWDGVQLAAACRDNPEFGLAIFSRLLELVAGRVKATEAALAKFLGGAGSTTGIPTLRTAP